MERPTRICSMTAQGTGFIPVPIAGLRRPRSCSNCVNDIMHKSACPSVCSSTVRAVVDGGRREALRLLAYALCTGAISTRVSVCEAIAVASNDKAAAQDTSVHAEIVTENDAKLIDPLQREPVITDRVFLDLAVGDAPPSRVVLGLYGEIVPNTVANFKALIENGYAGTRVYRIVPSLTIQMGDVLRNGGRSGRAATMDGKPLPAENYRISHTLPGIVSMARDRNGNVDSRFFVATRQGDSLYLDGRYVAFGRVVQGFGNLVALEALVKNSTVPSKPVVIQNCGLLPEG